MPSITDQCDQLGTNDIAHDDTKGKTLISDLSPLHLQEVTVSSSSQVMDGIYVDHFYVQHISYYCKKN